MQLRPTLHRVVNRLCYFEAFEVLRLTPASVSPRFADAVLEPFSARLLSADEVRAYALNPTTGLNRPAIAEAVAHGDHCVALFHRGRLANYGWYSTQPTRTTDELAVHFDERLYYAHHD